VHEAGRYRMVRRIGEGGMAEVFEAEALGEGGFRRRVAIKRLLAANAGDEAFRRMFLDEARIASQLHHAGIVAIVDFGISDGLPFQVLEYVDGPSLIELRELAGEIPVEVVLAIGTEIAHALEHAHQATDGEGRRLGIVHRDVSPGNILVAWSGDVKLTDFGIAFARGRDVTTSAGVAKGTLAFMAPEQVLRGELDGRTDVFGLGCVLALLATGASPLSTEGAMADLVAGGKLGLPASLPDDVRAIVARAIEGRRADRWESAAAMAAALGGALARRKAVDGKTLLREFLGRVRGGGAAAATPAARGRLDAVLDLELVLAATDNEVREFTVRPSREMPVVAEVERGRRPTVRLVRQAEPAEERPRPRRGVGLVGGGAVALVAIAALALKEGTRPPIVLPDPPAPPPVVVVEPPPPGHAGEDGERFDLGGAAGVRVPVVPASPRPSLIPDEVIPPSVTLGTLVIGGEGALRSEIFVDGKSRGFAPKSLELRLGDHLVELVGPGGEKKATRRVVLEARHTASAPLRWSVP
jgi:tRNA A-37 threonylcarbamoyl transferase component Bud32